MCTPSANARSLTCPQCGAPVSLPEYADIAVCPFCCSNLRRALPRPIDDWVPAGAAAEGGEPTPSGPWSNGRPASPAPPVAVAPPAVDAAQVPAWTADAVFAWTAGGGAASAADSPHPVSPSAQVLRSLSCPQCAGPLSVRAGRRILLCSRCGVRVLVRGRNGISRWLFPRSVDRMQALAAAARWLTTHPGISRGARDVLLRQARLFYVPVWEHRALVAGWEFGSKLRTRSYLAAGEEGEERLELALMEERFEDPHLQERRYFQAACDLAALGAVRPRFSGRELLSPLVADEIEASSTVLEVSGESGAVADQARRVATQPASGAVDPKTWMIILRESMSLLYYPLWFVDYRADGRSFRIVVDGREGHVNSAVAPAGDRRLEPRFYAEVGGLLAVAALAGWFASTTTALRVPSILLAVIVCVAAVLLVLKAPADGKVEYHEPFSN